MGPGPRALVLLRAFLVAMVLLGPVVPAAVASNLAQREGGSYESDEYGYTVEWESQYWVIDDERSSADDEVDSLILFRWGSVVNVDDPVYVELFVYSTGESDDTDPADYLLETVLQGIDEDDAYLDLESDIPSAEVVTPEGYFMRGEIHTIDGTLVVVLLRTPYWDAGLAVGDVKSQITLDGDPLFENDPVRLNTGDPSGDATAGDGDGAVYRGDPARTGELPGPGPQEEPDLLWEFSAGNAVASSPAIVDGVAYAGSNDGDLYALDVESGEEIWAYATGASYGIQSSPAVADDIVYFGTQDGTIFAVDAESGEEIWQFPTGGWVLSSPAVVDGIVYAGSVDGYLSALDAETGDLLWHYGAGGGIWSAPAVADGIVYIGVQDDFTDFGAVAAVDAETGEEIWRVGMEEDVNGAPAVVDGFVYVAESGIGIYALDAGDGDEEWFFPIEDSIYGALAVADGIVYGGTRTTLGNPATLYAIDAEAGEELWTAELDGNVTAPVVSDGVVYTGDLAGTVYAFDAEDGDELWTFEADGEIGTDVVVSDGVAYFGTRGSNTIYAISEDGEASSSNRDDEDEDESEEEADDEDSDTLDGSDAGIDGNSFQSPYYTFSFEWSDDWTATESDDPVDGQDDLTLTNDGSTIFVQTFEVEGSPEDCVEGTISQYEDIDGFDDIEPAEDAGGDEIAGSYTGDLDAYAGYSVVYEPEDGAATDLGIFISCWSVGSDPDATGRFLLTAPLSDFEEAIEALEEILETVEV